MHLSHIYAEGIGHETRQEAVGWVRRKGQQHAHHIEAEWGSWGEENRERVNTEGSGGGSMK